LVEAVAVDQVVRLPVAAAVVAVKCSTAFTSATSRPLKPSRSVPVALVVLLVPTTGRPDRTRRSDHLPRRMVVVQASTPRPLVATVVPVETDPSVRSTQPTRPVSPTLRARLVVPVLVRRPTMPEPVVLVFPPSVLVVAAVLLSTTLAVPVDRPLLRLAALVSLVLVAVVVRVVTVGLLRLPGPRPLGGPVGSLVPTLAVAAVAVERAPRLVLAEPVDPVTSSSTSSSHRRCLPTIRTT